MNIQSIALHKHANGINKSLKDTKRKHSQVSFGSDGKNEKYSFHFYPSSVNQVKLPGYIPDDVKINEVKMVNMARQKREYDWQYYIDNNYGNNNKIKFWRMLSSGIAPDNRQIPPPVSIEALNETIDKIDKLSEKECLEIYNSNLIKISLNEIQNQDKFKKTLLFDKDGNLLNKSDKTTINQSTAFWIKIPSQKKDSINYDDNVLNVERLSNPNWCTRSKDNKAKEVLQDGDFYIFVEKKKDRWVSKLAMTTYLGKIKQIQGSANDNLIPLQYLLTIKNFLLNNNYIAETKDGKIKNIGCSTGFTSDGPAAYTQLLISEFLTDFNV